MNCLCGRDMTLLWDIPGELRVFTCPPEGCGRIYLQAPGMEIDGTFYQPEQNKSEFLGK